MPELRYELEEVTIRSRNGCIEALDKNGHKVELFVKEYILLPGDIYKIDMAFDEIELSLRTQENI